MAERFFSCNPTVLPPFDNAAIILLSGPASCGKTSLLFQFAINRAAESGRRVVFICSKGRLENSPPFLSQGVDSSLDVLQRIQIKYIEDDEGIRNYFAAFHLLDNFPASVIVDDFTGFFSERSMFSFLLALVTFTESIANSMSATQFEHLCYNTEMLFFPSQALMTFTGCIANSMLASGN